jgi:hypothetical protein
VLGAVVGVFGVPVDALDSLLVRGTVHGLDQGPAQALAPATRIDEQVFQVAVAGPRPGRRMDMEVDDAGDALAIEGGEALERMGGVEQPAPGQVSEVGRQVVLVELQVAALELVPVLAIGRFQGTDVGVHVDSTLSLLLFIFVFIFFLVLTDGLEAFADAAHRDAAFQRASERAHEGVT